MDLKSVLNVDTAGQRAPPRLTTSTSAHTPTSSYDGRIDQLSHTPSGSSDVTSARPTPYGPPSHTGDPRAQSGGSYFANPPPFTHTSTSNSTPSAGPPSAYAQSPSSYHQVLTPRDAIVHKYNTAFATPSPGVYHPSTPGSAHHTHPPPSLLHQTSSQHQYQYSSPPPPQPNGLPPHSQHRQISPMNNFQSQPATPLGPPIAYPRASPQAQRPPSQGGLVDHLRRASQSSIGSVLSREYNHYPQPVPEPPQRRDSVQSAQRTSYPYEPRDREQSMSVSPKTIPRPNPNRENSASSHTLSHRASLPPQPDHHSSLGHYSSPSHQSRPLPSQLVTPDMSVAGSRPTSHDQITTSSPVPPANPMVSDEVKQDPQPSLKRSASHLEDSPSAPPPAPKRQRYDIPRWAQSRREQRGQKQIRYLDAHEAARDRERRRQQDEQKKAMQNNHHQNGMGQTNGAHNHTQQPVQSVQPPRPAPPAQQHIQNGEQAPHKWEGTVSNIIPHESLAHKICDWIISTSSQAKLPPSSKWEVEAKIGTIIDLDTRQRFHVQGVENEALLNTFELPRKIRFESNMPPASHEACYHYLRGNAERNVAAHKRGEVHDNMMMLHVLLRELDEFYELSPEGIEELDPQLRFWTDRSITRGRHSNSVRVRKTIDLESNTPRYMIKSRIADKEISYPDCNFDYRISISLETNWTGNEDHLLPLHDLGTRNKQRHSYRHREFQFDVTQVSHFEDASKKEHEVEVEISGDYLAKQLKQLLAGDPDNKYVTMVQDFINNTRLLCKHADPNSR